MTTTPPMPPSPTEARLRATLAAEADRHPVTPDLEGLRARRDGTDRAVIDLRLAPRRNRARIMAAAVVLAVLAAGATAVVRSGEDREAPVTSGAGASGYYLPGDGWDIVGVAVPSQLDRGIVREAIFLSEPSGSSPKLEALVARVTDPAGAPAAWEAAGADAVASDSSDPLMWVLDRDAGGDSATVDRLLLVPGSGDEVLVLGGSDVAFFEMVDVADRWLTSDGREIGPVPGLERWYDTTYADPDPIDGAVLVDDTFPPPGDAESPLVVVTVADADGDQTSYVLSEPGALGQPTGVGDEDGGTSRGLEPEARRQPVEGLRDDGEVWSVPGGPVTALVAFLPGADVSVSGVGPEESDSGIAHDDLRGLMGGLRPVDAATWAEAVRSAVGEDVSWPDRLADIDPGADDAQIGTTSVEGADPIDDGIDVGADTTMPAPASTEAATDTTEAAPGTTEAQGSDTTAPADDGLGGTIANDLVGLATGAAVVPEARIAPEITVGFVGGTDADVVLSGDERGDAARWVLEIGGRWGQGGPVSALDLVARGPVVAETPSTPDPTCVGAEPPAEPDVVVLEPADRESCLDWFGVVVRVDEQGRIAEVRVALWEP